MNPVKAQGSAVRKKATARRRDVMSSTLRCLQALELLAAEPHQYSLSDIASRLGLSMSSAHRILNTLVVGGLVAHDVVHKRYCVAGKALWIGCAYLRHSPLYRTSFAALENLARKSKTMAHLAVWDEDCVLYLHTVGPPRSPHLFSDTGERRPVHATALGKAMLAYRPAADLARIFSRPLERLTEKTITDRVAMEEELARIRDQGYALDDGECVRAMRCVAVPIRDASASVVGAISVSASRNDITYANAGEYARLVQEAALRVSIQLGHRPPTANLSSLLATFA